MIFSKITQHFDYLSNTIETPFEPANRKVTHLYLGLFIGNRFRNVSNLIDGLVISILIT